MQAIRVFFKKCGKAKYISHLDLSRAVTRALLRTGLPIHYTEGFNPHPKLVFALPLSVFQESEYEIFDFAVDGEFAFEEVVEKLRKALPPELEVIGCSAPVNKLKELKYAKYDLTVQSSLSPEELEKLFVGEVTVTKKTKSKTEDTDISGQIFSLKAKSCDEKTVITAVLSAGANEYLNPQYLVNFLGDKVTCSRIKRTLLLDGKMEALV